MNLLKLFVNGKLVKFFPDTKVKMVINTGIFSFGQNKPTQTYRFQIPAMDNADVFGVVNSVFSRNVVTEYEDCYAEFGGFNFGKCRVLITDWNDQSLTIQVLFNEGALGSFLNRSIKSFSYKNPYHFRYKLSQCYWSQFEIIAIANGTYTITVTLRPINNRYNPISQTFTVNYTGLASQLYTLGEQIITHFNQITNETGYFFEADPMGAQLFKVYAIGALREPKFDIDFISSNPSNFGIDSNADFLPSQVVAMHTMYQESLDFSKDYVFAPVYTPKLFNDDFLAANPGLVAACQNLNLYIPKITGNPTYPGTVSGSVFLPFAYLKSVIYQLHMESGLGVAVDDFFDTENSRLVLINKQPINTAHKKASKHPEYRATHVFSYADILPDFSIQELRTAFKQLFNTLLIYKPYNSTVEIKSIKNIMEGPSVDLTKKFIPRYAYTFKPNVYSFDFKFPSDQAISDYMPSFNEEDLSPAVDNVSLLPTPYNVLISEIRYVRNINKYYKWDVTAAKWVLFADGLYPKKLHGSNRNIQSEASPLVCVEIPFPASTAGLGAFSEVKTLVAVNGETGNNTDFDKQPDSLRLMYYRGFLPVKVKITPGGSLLDGEMPTLTNHNYDVLGNKIANKSLSWDGPDGLYETYFKDFIEKCASNSPMKLPFNFDVNDITSIDLFKIMVENKEYLVDEIEVEIGDQIGLAIATVYPIIY